MPQNSPKVGWSLLDHDGETGSCSGYIDQPTAVNLPNILTAMGTLRTAIEGITLGNVKSETGQFTNTKYGAAAPADPNAQRERKWLVFAEDVTEFLDVAEAVRNPNFRQVTHMEIPTAMYVDDTDDSLLLEGTEWADPADARIIAFTDAFEALIKSKAIGDLEVIGIKAVSVNT